FQNVSGLGAAGAAGANRPISNPIALRYARRALFILVTPPVGGRVGCRYGRESSREGESRPNGDAYGRFPGGISAGSYPGSVRTERRTITTPPQTTQEQFASEEQSTGVGKRKTGGIEPDVRITE